MCPLYAGHNNDQREPICVVTHRLLFRLE